LTSRKLACEAVRREVLYNIPVEFCIHMKLVRLIKMCLNEIYSRVSVGKHMYEMLHIRSGRRQDALSPLLFNFALEYAIRRVQVNQEGLKLNGIHQLLVYADEVNVWDRNVRTIRKNIDDYYSLVSRLN